MIWPDNGCYICGLAPNAFCTDYHLPQARVEIAELEEKLQRAKEKLWKYEETIGHDP